MPQRKRRPSDKAPNRTTKWQGSQSNVFRVRVCLFFFCFFFNLAAINTLSNFVQRASCTSVWSDLAQNFQFDYIIQLPSIEWKLYWLPPQNILQKKKLQTVWKQIMINTRPQSLKARKPACFSILNLKKIFRPSTKIKHEIQQGHKSQNANNCWPFNVSISLTRTKISIINTP